MKRFNGAVSLFVVLFTAFLFVAITVGFTVLMVSDQQRSTDNDLAQSARDSAEAGIEEAKRVLAQLEYCSQIDLGGESAAERAGCEQVASAVNNGQCNTINHALGTGSDNEMLIKKDEADAKLEQAVTCVRITPDTETYEGRLDGENDMDVVPIRALSPVSSIKVSWLNRSGVEDGTTKEISPSYNSVGSPNSASSSPGIDWSINPPILPTKSEWNTSSYGSILRVGSYQYPAGSMNLADIDNNSRAAFLYPTTSGGITGGNVVNMNDVDKHTHPQYSIDDSLSAGNRISIIDEGNIPQNIRCKKPGETTDRYLCSAIIELPLPIDSSTGSMKTYLTVASIYKGTDFRVELLDTAGDKVRFQNVQPEIDSTGRANDVFRRLVARVESSDSSRAPYPRAALGSSGSVCKAYMITDIAAEFTDYRVNTSDCPDVRHPNTITP